MSSRRADFAGAGLPGIEALAWNGIFVPAGTPRPVIDILHRELVRAYNAPDIKSQVLATGSDVAADTPEEFAAFIRAEKAKWGKVIKDAGIKPESVSALLQDLLEVVVHTEHVPGKIVGRVLQQVRGNPGFIASEAAHVHQLDGDPGSRSRRAT